MNKNIINSSILGKGIILVILWYRSLATMTFLEPLPKMTDPNYGQEWWITIAGILLTAILLMLNFKRTKFWLAGISCLALIFVGELVTASQSLNADGYVVQVLIILYFAGMTLWVHQHVIKEK